MNPPRGATLFEVWLMLGLILVLASIAIPPLHRAARMLRLRAAAHIVRSELHEARILAIVRNQDCRVRVTSPNSYLVEYQAASWDPVFLHELPPGFLISSNNSPEFHPLGNVGPMATIRVWNEHGDQNRLIVSRSGRIRME